MVANVGERSVLRDQPLHCILHKCKARFVTDSWTSCKEVTTDLIIPYSGTRLTNTALENVGPNSRAGKMTEPGQKPSDTSAFRHAPQHKRVAPSAASFSWCVPLLTYAHTVWPRTTKFSTITHTRRGVLISLMDRVNGTSHADQPKGAAAQRSNFSWDLNVRQNGMMWNRDILQSDHTMWGVTSYTVHHDLGDPAWPTSYSHRLM